MTTTAKYLRWVLWSLWYLPQRQPLDFAAGMMRITRTLKPWAKFRPAVWHNDAGGYWEVWWGDERDYSARVAIRSADVMIGMDTGKVVGLHLFDEVLAEIEAGQRKDEAA